MNKVKETGTLVLAVMLGLLSAGLFFSGLCDRAQIKHQCFCSYCAKQDVAYGTKRDSKQLPPPGQCPYSPDGKHRWLGTICSFYITNDIWRTTVEWHAHSHYDSHKFFFPEIMNKLQKFPDSERTWFLATYNHIIDTESEIGRSSQSFVRLVASHLWSSKRRLQDFRAIQTFLKEYAMTGTRAADQVK